MIWKNNNKTVNRTVKSVNKVRENTTSFYNTEFALFKCISWVTVVELSYINTFSFYASNIICLFL